MTTAQKAVSVLAGLVVGALLVSHANRLARVEKLAADVELQISETRGDVNRLRATPAAPTTDAAAPGKAEAPPKTDAAPVR